MFYSNDIKRIPLIFQQCRNNLEKLLKIPACRDKASQKFKRKQKAKQEATTQTNKTQYKCTHSHSHAISLENGVQIDQKHIFS